MSKKARPTISLSARMFAVLDAKAKELGVSKASLVERLVTAYLNSQERPQ